VTDGREVEREVVRCSNPKCLLNQFRTVNGNCRRCRQALPVEAEPETTGVKIEVLQSAEIVSLAPTSEPVIAEPFIPGPNYRKPRNREPKTKKLPKKKLDIAIEIPPRLRAAGRSMRMTARGCYDEVKRARTAKERREIIVRYLNA
jgi:hypothetical protein